METDKAKAEFENGVLTLNLPKAEVVKPKQIKISTK
ncbi:MAG: Hsp20/alpha crystallin family protein [Candidatus Roseilinea sp.]